MIKTLITEVKEKMKKITYLTLLILAGGYLQSIDVLACHDYSDAPKDYVVAYHNKQDYGYLGNNFDWENKADYQEDSWDSDYDGIDGDKYDDGLFADTLSGYTWIVNPGENALLTFTARQLTLCLKYNWVKIWIDWNKDKKWGSDEQVIQWEGWVPKKGQSISVGYNILIPSNFSGETWMRARISSNYGCFQPYTSGDWFRGEVEDYKIISSPPPHPTPIPEPSTIFLLGSGLIGLGRKYIKKR